MYKRETKKKEKNLRLQKLSVSRDTRYFVPDVFSLAFGGEKKRDFGMRNYDRLVFS